MDNVLEGVIHIPLPQLSVISVALAITSHLVFFKRFPELDSLFHVFFCLAFASPAALFFIFYSRLQQSVATSSLFVSTLYGSFLLGLAASILIYRIWFHPLHHIPGPFWAKTSKWWLVYQQWRTGFRFHQYAREMHKRYGDIVRIGPNDLSIIHPDIIPVLAKAEKGIWYTGDAKLSLQTVRNKKTHAIRRRVFEKAFTVKALQGYVPRIAKYSDQLISNIAKTAGSPTNVTRLFMFYTFDVMGDLAFGKPFGMLETKGLGGSDRFIKTMHGFMNVVGSVGHVTWFLRLLQWLPGLSGEFDNFQRWCGDMVEERKQYTPEEPDIFHYLLEAEPRNIGEHHIDLTADTQLACVAGSDTTANTLINTFAQLANNPPVVQKLQQEIDALYNSQCDTDKSTDIPEAILNGSSTATRYLNSVINESLRLNPAVPGGTQRVTPEGGTMIDGTYVPGGVYYYYPVYTAQSDERSYPEPLKFMPERWYELDKETIARQKAAFIPFSAGTFGCVGKSLALLQLRILTAKILRKFNIRFAEGNSIEKVYNNSFDTFTLAIGDIEMVFSPR